MIIPKPPTIKSPLKPVRTRTWEEVLEIAGFPRPVIVLDFETFFSSEVTLKKMSTIEHVTDEQFEVLGLDTVEEEATPRFLREPEVRTYLGHLQSLYGRDLRGCTVAAYNAAYEGAILNWIYGITPKYMVDILGLARHWNARARNGLEFVVEREGLPPKGDTLEFKDWTTRKRYKPRGGRGKKRLMPVRLPILDEPMWKKLADYANNDGFLEWELFKRYMPRLSRPEVELNAMNHTLHLYTEPRVMVDEAMGLDIIDAMEAEVDRVMAGVGCTRKQISGDNSFEELMTQALSWAGCKVGPYLKPAKNKKGSKLAIAKADHQRELLEEHEDPYVRDLMAAKNALGSWPGHITRVQSIIAQCKAAGGVLPVPLRYCGAHTGRWSGSEGINLQNLGSRGHDLIKRIRQMLVAPPGWEFVIGDAASIESRCLAHMAGQDDKLEKFARGEEMYCRFAEIVLNKPEGSLRKAVPEDLWEEKGCDPEEEKYMSWCRNTIGKTGDLACGYGGGPDAVAIFAPDLDLKMRTLIRDKFREVHPKIVKFWYKVQAKFIAVAKYGRPCSLPQGLSFRRTKDCDVVITLPSGRELKYHEVKITQDKYGKDQIKVKHPTTHQWKYTWGGTLTENIIQAVARDVLWEAIVKVEAAGHRVVHHVHDELIALVLKGMGVTVLNLTIKCLSESPKWAPTMPMGGEGVVTTRYGGH